MDYPMLALLALAAARATYLVTDDMFPFGHIRNFLLSIPYRPNGLGLMDKLRVWLHSGMSCTHCVSVHSGFWSTLLATHQGWCPEGVANFMVVWFSISGAVVLLEALHFRLMGDD